MIVNDFVSTSLSNANSLLNWSMQNKETSIRIVIPSITVVVSWAFFNLSAQSSAIFAVLSLGVTIIEQKDPNVKIKLLEKLKTVLTNVQEKKIEPEERDNESLLEKKKRNFLEYSTLMLSYLELSQSQILEDSKNRSFKIACKQLGLSDPEILTLLNYYELSPKSFKENEYEYEERLEKFISLLSFDKRYPFQEKLDEYKKKKPLAKTANEPNSTDFNNLLEFSLDQPKFDELLPNSFSLPDSKYLGTSPKDEVIEPFVSDFLLNLTLNKYPPRPVGGQSIDTVYQGGEAKALSHDQTETATNYVYYNIILNKYYQSKIRKIPGVTDENAYSTMPYLSKNHKSGKVYLTFPLNNRLHSIPLNSELKKAIKGYFDPEKKILFERTVFFNFVNIKKKT